MTEYLSCLLMMKYTCYEQAARRIGVKFHEESEYFIAITAARPEISVIGLLLL